MISSNNPSKLRILLVEDSEHDKIAFQRSFKKSQLSCEITFFERAEEALAKLRANESSFDIIVSDHGLPGLLGLDFCKELISDDTQLPLVLLTGSGSEEIAIEALKAGVHDYIVKDEYRRYLDLLPMTILGVVKRHRDKLLRIQAEEELRASKEYAQNLINSSLDMIISADRDRKIVEFNQAAQDTFGYAKEEVLGKTIDMLYANPDEGKANHKVLLENGKFWGEIINKRKNGETFPTSLSASVLLDSNGKFVGSMGTSRDITERKRAEKELKDAKNHAEDATKLKDKFVSLVAHDLKEPLSTLINSLNLFRINFAGNLAKEQKTILDIATQSGEKMIRLIDELLSVSRLKTGKLKPNSIFLDASLLGIRILADYEYAASQKGVKLKNKIPERTRIYADETLIYEVFQNLISNAIKFSKNGDIITIYVPPERPTTIAISDTGVGIEKERLDKLFNYEEKTSTIGTTGESGTGLGLPLCRDIMEEHGGGLSVESEMNKGSVFFAALPLVRPKVLVVEDSDTTRLVIKKFLSDLDVEILEAGNGKKGLEVLEKTMPHLILLDIMMPVMDGFEFLPHVKNSPKTKFVPVVVFTADTNMETREKVFRLGADDFVTKPLVLEELIPRVRRFII